MSPAMRLGFAVVAFAVLSGVAWFSFRHDAPAARVTRAAEPTAEPLAIEPVASAPASRVSESGMPKDVPYEQLTTVARSENRIIYTTSSIGEPMEVHPDGLVVIHNHRKLVKYADGREEVVYFTLRARPALFAAPAMTEGEDKPPK